MEYLVGNDLKMIWIYYYLLNRTRLDLDLDNSCSTRIRKIRNFQGYEKYVTLLQITLIFGLSHTKHSLTCGNRTC